MRLAVLATHPVQYYAPLFRELAGRVELHVFYGHVPTAAAQGVGFGTAFAWDVDLTSGFSHSVLTNVSKTPAHDDADTPEIGARLAEGRFDALLALGWYTRSLRQGIRAARRLGIPVLVRGDSQLALAGGPGRRAVKAATYPVLLRAFDAALTVGTRNAEFFRHYRFPAARMFPSPHAVDTAFFAAHGTPAAAAALRTAHGIAADAKVVLFAGKLVPFKRPLDVVDAAARLGDVTVLVAGAGEVRDALLARAAAAGVRVVALGFVNQSGMPAVYAAADVLALPSTGRETWGLVANEALACGTPVVVSDAAGCAPDLADGRAGLAFPCGDVAALAEALRRMLAGRDTAAIAARSQAHSLARAADGVVAALAAVSAGRR